MYPKKFWNEFRLPKWINDVFVGMWFDESNVSKRYTSIIEKAIDGTPLKARFLKKIVTGDSIPIDIMKGIIECRLVIFDISPMAKIGDEFIRNSNVMYELGLANAWRNPEEIIILRDDTGNLPFDVSQMGVVQYDSSETETAIEKIKKTILFRLDQIDKIQKSIVRKTAESLNIQAYSLLMVSKGKIFHDATLDGTQKILAIPVLLSLGLVEMLTDGHGYGYHPTQLGKAVIQYGGGALEEDDIKTYETLFKEEY